MKFLCGNDIVEISRIKKAIDTKGNRFIKKIYTEKEIEYCESKKANKYEHYAARFAAKEAIYKSISTKINNEYIKWKNIEILNIPNGKPIINLKYEIKDLESIDVSISHCKEYAIANSIAIFK